MYKGEEAIQKVLCKYLEQWAYTYVCTKILHMTQAQPSSKNVAVLFVSHSSILTCHQKQAVKKLETFQPRSPVQVVQLKTLSRVRKGKQNTALFRMVQGCKPGDFHYCAVFQRLKELKSV